VRSGTLRHQVSLLARDEGQDSVGQPATSYTAFGTDWASIDQPGGREFFDGHHDVQQTDVVLRMRWRDDLRALHRIAVPFRGQTYEVIAVADPDMRMRELYVLAKMVVQ